MANDVEYDFMCLFIFFISTSLKCLDVFCPFSNWVDVFFLLSFKTYLYILHTSALPDRWFANIFSLSLASLFIRLTGSFSKQKF